MSQQITNGNSLFNSLIYSTNTALFAEADEENGGQQPEALLHKKPTFVQVVHTLMASENNSPIDHPIHCRSYAIGYSVSNPRRKRREIAKSVVPNPLPR
jgi:hypothetical protein